MSERDERTASEERRIAEIYRQAAEEVPPPYLDAAIARIARDMTSRTPERRPAWWTLWRVPLALAAVAVVSVSLVTLMMEKGGERLSAIPSLPQGAAGPERDVPHVNAEPAPPARAEADAKRRSRENAGTDRRAAKQPPPRVSEPQPPPAPAAEPAASMQAPAAPSAAAARRADEAPPATADETLGRGAGSERRERRLSREEAASGSAQDRAAAPAPKGVMNAPLAERVPAAKPALSSEAAVRQLVAELEDKAPPLWLERVAGLRREGRPLHADALLAEFRRRFPSEPVPADLR